MFAMCVFVCTSCENGSGKASEKSVLKYLPGTWKITQIVDTDGTKYEFTDDAVFEFGKQESVNDFNNNHNSYLWGYCSITINGEKILNRGTWNIEPVSEDKGVFFYCQNGYSFFTYRGDSFFMITSISGSSMRWEDDDNLSGYILTRVK